MLDAALALTLVIIVCIPLFVRMWLNGGNPAGCGCVVVILGILVVFAILGYALQP